MYSVCACVCKACINLLIVYPIFNAALMGWNCQNTKFSQVVSEKKLKVFIYQQIYDDAD